MFMNSKKLLIYPTSKLHGESVINSYELDHDPNAAIFAAWEYSPYEWFKKVLGYVPDLIPDEHDDAFIAVFASEEDKLKFCAEFKNVLVGKASHPTEIIADPDELVKAYKNIRFAIHEFETILHEHDIFHTDREEKLADKSIVLLKVGAKLLKNIVRGRGVVGRLKDWDR